MFEGTIRASAIVKGIVMASQPANTTITVARRVRSLRKGLRHNNVKALVNRMRPQIMSVPSEEVQIARTFDTTSDHVTTALAGAGNKGLPIVVHLRDETTFAAAAEGIDTLDFPVRVGEDAFLQKSAATLADDLHQELRDVA